MTRYLLGRAAQALFVVFVVAFIAFAVFQFVGDPVTSMLGQDASPAQREQLRRDLGLDAAFPVQFGRFVARAAQGDFGISYQQGRSVSALLLDRAPATIELAVASIMLALCLGIPAGIWSAVRPRRRLARMLNGATLGAVSLPTFLSGLLLIMIFSVILGWLPSNGRGQTSAIGWWRTGLLGLDGWRHLLLPALTLGLLQFAIIVRLVRSEIREQLRSEYVRFARARGIPERQILYRHALRNAANRLLTIIAMQLGTVIAFAIVTETVFQWPGLGLMFIQAVRTADIPVMAAYLCLVGAMFAMLSLFVDLLAPVLDPRLRQGRAIAARD